MILILVEHGFQAHERARLTIWVALAGTTGGRPALVELFGVGFTRINRRRRRNWKQRAAADWLLPAAHSPASTRYNATSSQYTFPPFAEAVDARDHQGVGGSFAVDLLVDHAAGDDVVCSANIRVA